MKLSNLILWCAMPTGLLLAGCAADQPAPPEQAEAESQAVQPPAWRFLESGDLTAIRRRGVLRVLAPARPEREHLPRSEDPFQRERELAAEYARELDLDLLYVPVDGPADLIPWLREGKGDLALVKLPEDERRAPGIGYSVAVKRIREIVATRADDDGLQSAANVAGREIAVLRSGLLTRPAAELAAELPGARIVEVEDLPTPDDLLHEVSRGRYQAALVDSNWWHVAQGYRSDLRVAFELPVMQRLVVATRADAVELLQSANDFLLASNGDRSRRRLATGDLPSIRERGVLRVLLPNEAPSYFLDRGELRGFEYELVLELAERMRLRLEIVVPPHDSDLIPWLREGRADLVAASLRSSSFDLTPGVAPTRPYFETPDVLVARADGPLPAGAADLEGRSVYAVTDARPPDWIAARPTPATPEDLIERVAAGEIDLAVLPQSRLDWERQWRDDVQEAFPLGEAEPRFWLVRQGNPQLLEQVNTFLDQEYRGVFYNVVRNRYFGDDSRRFSSAAREPGQGRLSPYDELVQRYAETYDIEWRVAVALMYQESRFDPKAESAAGAVGLFQMLPSTAREMGFTHLTQPEISVQAALKYLHWIRERFSPDLELADRAAFTAASYNAGYGHVLDARRLAEARGLDPDRWFGNVEETMLLLSHPEFAREARFGYCRGQEPYRYVRDIRDRFQVYMRESVH